MQRWCKRWGGLIFCMLAGAAFAQTPAQPEPPTIAGAELGKLLASLKTGGHVIFFRHLDTRQDQEDRQPIDLNDCQAQRNLSDIGRERGQAIARAFRQSRIPVADVVASPFCRTQESARLMFGQTRTDADLFFAIALTDAGKQQKGAALRKLLATPPAPGSNSVIVSHTANLQEAVGFWPKPEGVAYVFKPDGQGGLRAVARIAPDSWPGAPR